MSNKYLVKIAGLGGLGERLKSTGSRILRDAVPGRGKEVVGLNGIKKSIGPKGSLAEHLGEHDSRGISPLSTGTNPTLPHSKPAYGYYDSNSYESITKKAQLLQKIAGIANLTLGGVGKAIKGFGKDLTGSTVGKLEGRAARQTAAPLAVGKAPNTAFTNKALGAATTRMNSARSSAMKVGGGIMAGGLATKALSGNSNNQYQGQY